jgi:hypothetical protein
MAAKLSRLTHKIAIQLHLVAESCIICSSRSRWPVRKLLDTPSYKLGLAQRCTTELSRVLQACRPLFNTRKISLITLLLQLERSEGKQH